MERLFFFLRNSKIPQSIHLNREVGMKVVHWAPQFGSETGTGIAIDGWLEAVSSRGLNCTVISLPCPALTNKQNSKVNVRSARGIINRLITFEHEIKTANVVHLHGAFDLKLCAVHAIIALEKTWRMFTGEPLHIVMTPHGALSEHVFSTNVRRKWLYWNCIERLLAKQTSLAICTTPVEARELQVLLPKMRLEVVPLVVSDELLKTTPVISKRETDACHIPTLCTLGRYDIRTKGLDLLINAVVKLNREGTAVRLRCIGYDRKGGSTELEEYVKSAGAGEYVECTGPKFGEAKHQSLAECDVFCMPSRYESFSYALMEGMGSGLPVLVGSGACLTSFLREDQKKSMVVQPSVDSWETSIKQLLSDYNSRSTNLKLAEEALRSLRVRCSAAIVSDTLGGLYHTILEEGRPHMKAKGERVA